VDDVPSRVRAALAQHPSVREVRLAGSRATGCALPLSDWDFEIDSPDPRAVVDALPLLVQPLEPIVAQFDRLAYTTNYMLLLHGPVKIDLIFPDLPWPKLPPWEVSRDTLPDIDGHFWDWILWLASKVEKNADAVPDQFDLMSRHLLAPLGAKSVPASVEDAIQLYRDARAMRENDFGIELQRDAEHEVCAGLRNAGYNV
jgi:hypothetical protein